MQMAREHMLTIILMLLFCCRDFDLFGARIISGQTNWGDESADSDDFSDSNEQSSSTTSSNDDLVFIGDMAFKRDSTSNIQANGNIAFSMVKDKRRIWPNAQLPYRVHGSVARRERQAVRAAIRAMEKETCIRFVKYDSRRHHNYVLIKSTERSCFSLLGQVGGEQPLNLEPGHHCGRMSTVIHEFMHALGIFHEQNRYDRDDYIEVLWQNLVPDAVSQYDKVSAAEMTAYGEAYDYGSIMHYGMYQGTKDGHSPAFRVLRPYDEASIGKAQYFSPADIRKLNRLYSCDRTRDGDDDEDTSSSDDDNDGTGISRPRPTPQPISNTGIGCSNGCCCTCNCVDFLCHCNCPCVCVRRGLRDYNCNCECNRVIFVPSLFNYQHIPQNGIIIL